MKKTIASAVLPVTLADSLAAPADADQRAPKIKKFLLAK
jgi:hypothetical protein